MSFNSRNFVSLFLIPRQITLSVNICRISKAAPELIRSMWGLSKDFHVGAKRTIKIYLHLIRIGTWETDDLQLSAKYLFRIIVGNLGLGTKTLPYGICGVDPTKGGNSKTCEAAFCACHGFSFSIWQSALGEVKIPPAASSRVELEPITRRLHCRTETKQFLVIPPPNQN